MMIRRDFLTGVTAAATLPALPARAAGGGTLRIAMTAADLPSTHGIPNNGFEGFRFAGYPAYDALVNWDLRHNPDQPAQITPGLFTAWKTDETNPLRWIFTVRKGAKFHDGSEFNADAVIWNLRRVYDEKAPHYDAPAAPIVKAAVSMVDTYDKAGDYTIVVTTKYPFSFLPYLLTRILIVSPAQYEAVGKNWAEFGKKPSGTGPFKITRVVPGQYIEMVRNEKLLGPATNSQVGETRRQPDGGSDNPHRRAALRPGGLDRGASAGQHSITEAGRVHGHAMAVSTYVSLLPEHRGGFTVQGRAGAAGDELRDRSGRVVQPAERHRQAGGRALPAG